MNNLARQVSCLALLPALHRATLCRCFGASATHRVTAQSHQHTGGQQQRSRRQQQHALEGSSSTPRVGRRGPRNKAQCPGDASVAPGSTHLHPPGYKARERTSMRGANLEILSSFDFMITTHIMQSGHESVSVSAMYLRLGSCCRSNKN